MILGDSNVWIFANIEEYPEHSLATNKLKYFESETIAINSVIFSESFHKLSVLLGKEEAVKRMNKIINSEYVAYIDLGNDTIRKSLLLAQKLRINDALIAQHAIDLKIPLLTDNVKDFRKISNLNIISLR